MPRMRVTDLGRSRLYLTRNMWANTDEAFIEPECVEVAKRLGYVEDVTAEEPAPVQKRRGRPPKQAAAAPATSVVYGGMPAVKSATKPMTKSEAEPLEEKTVPELREMAEELGVELPSGYVTKDELVDLVGAADDDDDGA